MTPKPFYLYFKVVSAATHLCRYERDRRPAFMRRTRDFSGRSVLAQKFHLLSPQRSDIVVEHFAKNAVVRIGCNP